LGIGSKYIQPGCTACCYIPMLNLGVHSNHRLFQSFVVSQEIFICHLFQCDSSYSMGRKTVKPATSLSN